MNRSIATVPELSTLPIGTVLLSATQIVYVLRDKHPLWDRPGRLGGTLPEHIGLPATVLHTPGESTAAAVKVEALREASEALDDLQTPEAGLPADVRRDPALWLAIRADEIENAEKATS